MRLRERSDSGAHNCTTVWGVSVKLAFKALKTTFMVFSRRPRPQVEYQPFTVNDIPTKSSHSGTYLGLILDDKLTWREHITTKCVKVKRLLFIVYNCCRLSWVIGFHFIGYHGLPCYRYIFFG